MFKNQTVLEVKANEDRIHSYVCDPKSPLGEVYDCLNVMRSYVLKKMQEQEEKKQEVEDAKEDGQESCEDGVEK